MDEPNICLLQAQMQGNLSDALEKTNPKAAMNPKRNNQITLMTSHEMQINFKLMTI